MDVQALLARFRTATSALSTGQLVTLALTFVAVVVLMVSSAYWVNAPTYSVLFADMDAETAGGIVARLKNDKIAYQIDEGGRTVRVPSTRVDELRLELASQGMPASGRIGFEIFDRTAFGVTDFLEHVNYRRALEGELARTIGTIAEVASARVHIAMSRESLFAAQEQAAKASVVLKLRNNRQLPSSTINAISGLVAAAVESLRPEAVVIIDNYGRPLTRSSDSADEAGSGAQMERQRQIERELSARVVSLIEPIVGSDHVRVNVSARLNGDSQEETEERWDPTPVIRSQQSVSQGSTPLGGAQGVAGSRANMPNDQNTKAPPPAAPQVAAPTHTAETTNYEVSRLTRHRIQPRGGIAHLSVAVLLDEGRVPAEGAQAKGAKPRTPEDIQKIHDVVAASVGLDTDRGDQLTVESVAFEEPTADAPAAEPWLRQHSPQLLDASRVAAVLLIAAFLIFGVVRPTLKRALPSPSTPALVTSGAAGALQVPRTIADMEGAIDAELDGDADAQPRRLPALTRRVTKLTQAEPEAAARLIRSWLSEEER